MQDELYASAERHVTVAMDVLHVGTAMKKVLKIGESHTSSANDKRTGIKQQLFSRVRSVKDLFKNTRISLTVFAAGLRHTRRIDPEEEDQNNPIHNDSKAKRAQLHPDLWYKLTKPAKNSMDNAEKIYG